MTQRAVSIVSEQGLLDLCEPPAGMVFRRGLWATFDCNGASLADLVAPRLVGVAACEGDRRRQEARAAGAETGAQLVVFAADQRVSSPPVMPWVTVHSLGDRWLHAKFAVLQFGAKTGSASVTRAFVTSANVTEGGLRKNRELVVWEDTRSSDPSPKLSVSLLREFQVLAGEATPSTVRLVREMRRSLQGTTLPGVHSTVSDNATLFRRMREEPVERLVIVSPAFASNADRGAVAHLAPFLGPDTRVEIYTGVGVLPGSVLTPETLRWSKNIAEGLQKRAAAVTFFGVPELEDETDGERLRERRLHAKMFALVAVSGDARVIVGSANCSGPALSGRNRELVVEIDTTELEVDRLLSALRAIPATGHPARAERMRQPVSRPMPHLTATFFIAAGERASALTWRGILRLAWPADSEPNWVRYGGRKLELIGEQTLVLSENLASLEARYDFGTFLVPIQVIEPDEGFWGRIGSPDGESVTQDLLDLLADLRKTTAKTKKPVRRREPGEGKEDDAFRLPLSQRLVRLARKRREIAPYLYDLDIVPLLRDYLQHDEGAADCAIALFSAYADIGEIAQDPVHLALQHAVAPFDAELTT